MDKNRVIVYGTDTQIGLAIVRELGKAGCYVVGVGKSENSLGLKSRYVRKKYVLTGGSDQQKVRQLNEIAQENMVHFLLCVSESDILFFNRVKDCLKNIVPLVPSLETINQVLDKSQTARLARLLGINTPKTYLIQSLEDVFDLEDQLSYPLILKWHNPHSVMESAQMLNICIEKIVYCHSFDSLVTELSKLRPLGQYPMVQEYCPGYGLGQFFFMHQGEAILKFQHRRIHEWPPEGGFSTLCESIPLAEHDELQTKSIALLAKLRWEGVAMVEYRFDPISNRAVLMEINGRFWGSLPLAYHSNVPFAWYTYKVLGLGEIPNESPQIIQGLQCRNLLLEVKRLHRIVFQPGKIRDKSLSFNNCRELLDLIWGFFRPQMRYYIFEADDLRPLLQDLKNLVSKRL